MECPYCKNMMESGVIQGERGDLKIIKFMVVNFIIFLIN